MARPPPVNCPGPVPSLPNDSRNVGGEVAVPMVNTSTWEFSASTENTRLRTWSTTMPRLSPPFWPMPKVST